MSNTPSANASTNLVRTIVPWNNLAQEKEYCASYYFPYEQCVCQREESSQKLVTQDQIKGHSHNTNGSQLQQGDHSFMNH